MKIVFFLLLVANLALLPLLQSLYPSVTEPERLARQLNPERLTLLDAEPPPRPADAAGTKDAAPSCVDVGEFSTSAAERFEAQLSVLTLGELPSKRLVRMPPQHVVFLPPQASATAAGRRLLQLRELGFADSAVIRDEPSRGWAVSLGLFSRLDLAEAHLEKLRAAGVSDARIAEYPVNSARYAYRLSGLDAAGEQRLSELASGFASVTLQPCQ